MKKITIVWTLILIIIIGGLTVVGMRIKDDKVSNIMEDSLSKNCEKYLNYYVGLYPKLGANKKITSQELIDAGYDPKLNDNCTGYVIVSNTNRGFEFKPYVKCIDYVTDGYAE